MKTDIYKSQAKPHTYLFVKAGQSPRAVLPKSALAEIGKFSRFKTINLTADSPLIGADPGEILRNLKQREYHVQLTRVTVTVTDDTLPAVGVAAGTGILVASLGGGPIGALVGAIGGYYLAQKTSIARGQ